MCQRSSGTLKPGADCIEEEQEISLRLIVEGFRRPGEEFRLCEQETNKAWKAEPWIPWRCSARRMSGTAAADAEDVSGENEQHTWRRIGPCSIGPVREVTYQPSADLRRSIMILWNWDSCKQEGWEHFLPGAV